METEFTPFMRDLEARFMAATGFVDRSQYKIFYGQVHAAWLLTLGINPAAAPAATDSAGKTHTPGKAASSSATYFENNEHDILDCEWSENLGLRKLLLPLLDDTLSRVRDEVVKTNMAFRRSAKASHIKKEHAFDESAPYLKEIVRVVRPQLVLLTGPSLASFNDRFAKDAKFLCAPERKESINQTVFAASRVRLRVTDTSALVVQVAHASQWSATYAEYDVARRIQSLMEAP